MLLTLTRRIDGDDCTIGNLELNNIFLCNTLEDKVRKEKIYGKTAIPEGEYEIGFRREGGFYNKYKQRASELSHHLDLGMIEIKNVPDFKYILIHIGNKSADSEGCVLIGTYRPDMYDNMVVNSTNAYKRVYPLITSYMLFETEKIKTQPTILITNDFKD